MTHDLQSPNDSLFTIDTDSLTLNSAPDYEFSFTVTISGTFNKGDPLVGAIVPQS